MVFEIKQEKQLHVTEVFFERREDLAAHLSQEVRYAVITDERVAELYGKSLCQELRKKGFDISFFAISSGEASKDRNTKLAIEDALLSQKLGRDAALIALGGGVVLDVAGFVAATYCRGIPLISLPTTLLAMIDASIGGKTGVNTPEGKNLIGAFHPAQCIVIDVSCLDTLPEEEWQNGYAEMIKYGLIASSSLFDLLERKGSMLEGIEQSIAIKKAIIEKDFCEQGMRRVLNFGHTVGHAVEALLNYRIAHGKAVALGMAFESYLSCRMGILSQSYYARIIRTLHSYGFSLKMPEAISFEAFLQALCRDKKALGSQPRFVLLERIGSTVFCEGKYCASVPTDLLQEVYEHFLH